MVAFNFKSQFADAVESGSKRSTIRARKRARPGDALQLYTGQRTKKCRKLRDAVCAAVDEISIDVHGQFVAIRLNGDLLPKERARAIAIADGFDGASAFAQFFDDNYGLPFCGWLHSW